jgi:magnesium chelatase family protein
MHTSSSQEEHSETVRQRVQLCYTRQLDHRGKVNAQLSSDEIKKYCTPDETALQLLEHASRRLGLSARAYHRILRLARTIADLEASEVIRQTHVSEAIGYRRLDRSSSPAAMVTRVS